MALGPAQAVCNSVGPTDVFGSPVAADLQSAFAPATHYVYEWTDYWLECRGADELRVGSRSMGPVVAQLFRVRFENELGLAAIQPFSNGRPLSVPLVVEVISPKFPAPATHLAFFRALLDDLFVRAARLPFALSGRVGRGVGQSLRPPSPFFVLHFLCQHALALAAALAVVEAAPHHDLRDHPELVPIDEATEVDADVLVSILQAPQELTPAPGLALSRNLRGLVPARLWQRCPEETVDTPENRFVRNFVQQVLAAAESLPSQLWWPKVPVAR